MRLPRSSTTRLFRHSVQRRCISDISDSRPFAPGDLVLLRQKQDRTASPILTRPLQPGRRIEGHRGVIPHDEIIGKRVRDLVRSSHMRSTKEGTEWRLHKVTLEDYVRFSRRLVTPIYPADANLIVNLLDLHPDAGELGENAQKLEILEAGTGHGALTLHLSRAIHAANSNLKRDNVEEEDDSKALRSAVIHTIDVSPKFSEHAQKVVQGFRNGLYARNVDFHVGDVSDVLRQLRESRGTEPFLSHAFLDMPAADAHLDTVADSLRIDGTLIVFNPSITQITACASKVKDDGIELDLEKVVELGVNGGSGGREWDVRFVRPRTKKESPQTESDPESASETGSEETGEDGESGTAELHTPVAEEDRKWSMVCRPKVGERIVGGGFLGVWKKQRDQRASGDIRK